MLAKPLKFQKKWMLGKYCLLSLCLLAEVCCGGGHFARGRCPGRWASGRNSFLLLQIYISICTHTLLKLIVSLIYLSLTSSLTNEVFCLLGVIPHASIYSLFLRFRSIFFFPHPPPSIFLLAACFFFCQFSGSKEF